MEDKPINWIGSSLEDLCSFPEEVKRKAGFELRKIQQGQDPTDFKPMSIVGKGVQEIRIRTEDAYRIFYVAKFAESIYVLHTFQKKTQKTAKGDIELGQKRYEWMLQEREQIDKENN
jgi:phage-related protein